MMDSGVRRSRPSSSTRRFPSMGAMRVARASRRVRHAWQRRSSASAAWLQASLRDADRLPPLLLRLQALRTIAAEPGTLDEDSGKTNMTEQSESPGNWEETHPAVV